MADDDSLVTVATFRDLLDAEAAKSRLVAEDIECYLADDHIVSFAWIYSGAMGGVKVRVPEAQAEKARAALAEDHTAEINEAELDGPPLETRDACPRCGSTELRGINRARYSAAITLAFPLPLIFWGRRVRCRRCGLKWKRNGA